MKLIDKEKLLEDLKQKRYSKQSLELIENQPEIRAIPVYWLIDQYLNGSCVAGCVPRYDTIKEAINLWYEANGHKEGPFR